MRIMRFELISVGIMTLGLIKFGLLLRRWFYSEQNSFDDKPNFFFNSFSKKEEKLNRKENPSFDLDNLFFC